MAVINTACTHLPFSRACVVDWHNTISAGRVTFCRNVAMQAVAGLLEYHTSKGLKRSPHGITPKKRLPGPASHLLPAWRLLTHLQPVMRSIHVGPRANSLYVSSDCELVSSRGSQCPSFNALFVLSKSDRRLYPQGPSRR